MGYHEQGGAGSKGKERDGKGTEKAEGSCFQVSCSDSDKEGKRIRRDEFPEKKKRAFTNFREGKRIKSEKNHQHPPQQSRKNNKLKRSKREELCVFVFGPPFGGMRK